MQSAKILDYMQEKKMYFARLDDSPMFRQQIQLMEEGAETLRDRCLKFNKGCRKYIDGLGEAYDRDIAFANSLEHFGGGQNDHISVAFGGPDMTKFAIALREIGTYKETLQSQVEHVLNEKLIQFANDDLQDVKEAHKRFDKASVIYDQVREKFLSLRKSARMDIASALEEVGALSAVEAKKRFEFLEAVGNTMDAHLRYFKQGFELLHQMEPYINQVLDYAQQARQNANYEQSALNERMQEYMRQVDLESRRSFADATPQPVPRNSSDKLIEAVMHSSIEGKVQTIKQGYLSKRSSNLRGDWKRRFFVLDSRGMLYYYRKQWSRPLFHGSSSQMAMHRSSPCEPAGSGLLSRWLSSHYHGGVHDEKSVARHTVNLLTSTIKVDAEQLDLRFCFRIISPTKNYTLQAENAADQKDWIEKITGVITSLLSSQTPDQRFNYGPYSESSPDEDARSIPMEKNRNMMRATRSSIKIQYSSMKNEKPLDALKKMAGNDKCADCGAPEPDWASLNIGVLVCIQCSGIHRNLGVHISKVRSLTLDVKVWEPSVITMFQALGNSFVNSIWEGSLRSMRTVQADELPIRTIQLGKYKQFFTKPLQNDHISVKEKFINAKYAEKRFVSKAKGSQHLVPQLQESVRINDKKAVYRLIITCEIDVNAIPIHGQNSKSLMDDTSDDCTLLHLACQTADVGMVELLLQYGADINSSDSRGFTPLHHSIIRGRLGIAKLLVTRGANTEVVDNEGKTPLQLLQESTNDDIELLALMKNAIR